MKRALLLAALLSMFAACSAAPVDEETSLLDGSGADVRLERPSEAGFQNFSDGLSEHFRDCGKGLAFTFQAFESRFREDSERFTAAFE